MSGATSNLKEVGCEEHTKDGSAKRFGVAGRKQPPGNLNWFSVVWRMKKFIENSVDSVKLLAYNDIEAESLLRNLKSVMHNTKGGMLT